jgi:hypothetical protein
VNEEAEDPLTEFVFEATNEVMNASPGAKPATRADIEKLLTRFTSFEAGAPVDQGYERILITKAGNWIPASGRSVKPGNLRFNLGTLFEAIASGVAASFAASTTPIVAVFTGLLAIRELMQAAKVDLSEREALVIWSLWSCEQQGVSPTTERIRLRGLAEAARVGSALQLSAVEVEHSLERLEQIGAARRVGSESWETRESVTVRT